MDLSVTERTVRIFTGAPIPEGANAIVIQEDTKAKGDKIVIKSSVEVGSVCSAERAGF